MNRREPMELMRYGMALAGPVTSAVVQFLLYLTLLGTLDASGFGRFSFLLIVAQFALGIWSALFCAPMPLLMAESNVRPSFAMQGLATANIYASAAVGAMFFVVASALGEQTIGSFCYAAFGTVSMVRWFGRSHAYALGHQRRAAASDLVYSSVLLIGVVYLFNAGTRDTTITWMIFALANVAGIAPLGRGFLASNARSALSLGNISHYRAIWFDHARWSLFGVLTSEATANAHAYLVTLALNPAAFAPLAASAVLIRPVSVATNALGEFERARLARLVGTDDVARVRQVVRFFRLMLLLAWGMTAIAALVLFKVMPGLVFPPQYPVAVLYVGAALWLLTALLRLLRTPDSIVLQAGGGFRPLALTGIWSSLASLASVALLLATAPPVWSIAGIALGEGVACLLIVREARRWIAQWTRRAQSRTIEPRGVSST